MYYVVCAKDGELGQHLQLSPAGTPENSPGLLSRERETIKFKEVPKGRMKIAPDFSPETEKQSNSKKSQWDE